MDDVVVVGDEAHGFASSKSTTTLVFRRMLLLLMPTSTPDFPIVGELFVVDADTEEVTAAAVAGEYRRVVKW